jgi:hypothetical protein
MGDGERCCIITTEGRGRRKNEPAVGTSVDRATDQPAVFT